MPGPTKRESGQAIPKPMTRTNAARRSAIADLQSVLSARACLHGVALAQTGNTWRTTEAPTEAMKCVRPAATADFELSAKNLPRHPSAKSRCEGAACGGGGNGGYARCFWWAAVRWRQPVRASRSASFLETARRHRLRRERCPAPRAETHRTLDTATHMTNERRGRSVSHDVVRTMLMQTGRTNCARLDW